MSRRGAAAPAPGTPARRPVNLTRDIPVPAEAVLARLAGDPGAVVGVRLEPSTEGGSRRVGIKLLGDLRVEREVKLGFGPPVEEDDGTVVLPLWWEATEHPWLFPTFDGGLEIGQHGTGAELRLVGSWRPPLGRLGGFADEIAGFRVARATLEAFLDEVAVNLAET